MGSQRIASRGTAPTCERLEPAQSPVLVAQRAGLARPLYLDTLPAMLLATSFRSGWCKAASTLISSPTDVMVTTFLSDRRYGAENRAVRELVLGDHAPALTVIITGILDEAWLVEIEAIAAA